MGLGLCNLVVLEISLFVLFAGFDVGLRFLCLLSSLCLVFYGFRFCDMLVFGVGFWVCFLCGGFCDLGCVCGVCIFCLLWI